MGKVATNRYDEVDMIKGIGIILVVLGHCEFGLFHEFIYLFHLSLFIIVSGYCFNSKNANNIIWGIKKKIKSLYLPFIISNLCFLFLRNIFIDYNILTTNKMFLESDIALNYGVTQRIVLKELPRAIIQTLMLRHTEQLAGGTWFLSMLFIISVMFILIYRISQIDLLKGKEIVFLSVTVFLSSLLGFIAYSLKIRFPWGIDACCSAYVLYFIGYIIKIKSLKLRLCYKYTIILILCSICSLLFLLFIGKIELSENHIINPLFFILASLLGYVLVGGLVTIISKIHLGNYIFKRILIYIGRNSIQILLLHFLAFKVINLIQICVYSLPKYYLAGFPVIYSRLTWVPWYVIVGIGIPLFFGKVFSDLILKLSHESHR
ncbi:MAG: hypothetical protein K0S01_1880 [Herbinix sp.]|jgi:fucose 4-O-acetylase-like acetyltransferase|nr:hypothetical protein [Herbinix sp.]